MQTLVVLWPLYSDAKKNNKTISNYLNMPTKTNQPPGLFQFRCHFFQEVRISSEQIEQQLRGFKASVNIDESQTSNQELQLCGRNHHQMLMEGLDLFKRDSQLWRI